MIDDSKHLDNNDAAGAAPARRPGRPKGLPKPPGSGRKKGTPNKATRDIRALAQKDGPKVLEELKRLAFRAEDERTRLAAMREYLDRAYGKPVQPSEVSGPDGAPISHETRELTDIDIARRIAFGLAKGARAAEEAAKQGGNVTILPTARNSNAD